MALMEKITDPSEASEPVAHLFTMMKRAVGAVPEPLKMLAISPGLLEQQSRLIGYYRAHEKLTPELLAFIRYTSALYYANDACIAFNGMLLKKLGVTDEELAAAGQDPLSAPLEERDKALLSFVYKGVRDQDAATPYDINLLRARGWEDADILDAVNHGFSMFAPGRMLRLFRMV